LPRWTLMSPQSAWMQSAHTSRTRRTASLICRQSSYWTATVSRYRVMTGSRPGELTTTTTPDTLVSTTTTERNIMYRDLADFKAQHKAAGGHFFDRGAMQFFNSRVESTLLKGGYF